MRASVCVLVVSLCALCTALPGASIYANPQVLNYLKTIVIQDVNLYVRNLQVPDVHGDQDGTTFSLSDIAFLTFTAPPELATLTINAGTGFTVTLNNVYYAVGMGYSFTKDAWPHFGASGIGMLLCNQTTVTLEIAITMANNALSSSVVAASSSIGYGELDGFPSELTLTAAQVEAEMNKQLTIAIDTRFNAKLQELTYLAPGKDGWDLDIHPVGNPDYQSSGVFYPARAAFVPTGAPGQLPPFAPDMPRPDAPLNGDNLQVFVGDYVINSLFWQEWKAGKLSKAVTNSMIPSSSPFNLNTSSWVGVIDPLPQKWPNTLMVVNVDAISSPTITIGAGGASTAACNLLMSFNVLANPTVLAFSVSTTFTSQLSFTLNGHSIAGQLNNANFTTITLVKNNIGTWDPLKLLAVLDFLIQGAQQDINTVLAKGKLLPDAPEDWSYGSVALSTGTGYLALTVQATYTSPTQPYVRCPDKSTCPYLNTCCAGSGNAYSCCPAPAATCCSGGTSCCPHAYACVNGNTECQPIDSASLGAGVNGTIPAISLIV